MTRIAFLIFFSLSSNLIFAQGWIPAGGKSMSLANASVTFNDAWAYFNNPGATADIDKFSVGLSYENRFLLKELQSQGLAIVMPLKVGVLSVGGHMYGYREYRSYKAGAGYSMKLSENLFAGVQLNYQGLSLNANYGTKSSMTAEAGIYAKLSQKWKLGITVFNVGRAKLSNYEDDRFSTVMRFGSAYKFSQKINLAVELEKDLDYKLRFKSGVEYQLVDNFFIRGGFATAPIELTFGIGYKLKQIQLDLGSAYHQILGWSPHFSILFQGK